jgi:hypothetical protein
MGNFVLAVLSRSTVNAFGKTTCGTEKKFGCTGRGAVYKEGINGTGSTTEADFTDEMPHKGANNRCKCEFVAEYVIEANGVTGEGCETQGLCYTADRAVPLHGQDFEICTPRFYLYQ